MSTALHDRRIQARMIGFILTLVFTTFWVIAVDAAPISENCPAASRWPTGYVTLFRSSDVIEGLRIEDDHAIGYGLVDLVKFSLKEEQFHNSPPQPKPLDIKKELSYGSFRFKTLRESFGPGLMLVENVSHICVSVPRRAREDREVWSDLEVFHLKQDQDFCSAKGPSPALHPATQRLLNFGAQLTGPASFRADRDLEFLLRLLAQPEARRLHTERPEIFEAVLQGVLFHSNFLFAELSRRHPWLSEGFGYGYQFDYKARQYCRNVANEALALRSTSDFIDAWGSSIAHRRDLKIQDFKFLYPIFGVLRQVLPTHGEDRLNFLVSKILQPLANSAVDHPATKIYWRSVSFQLLEKLIKSWFEGTEWWPERTDLVATKYRKNLRFDLVGNFPFSEKSKPNAFGFFVEPRWTLTIPKQTADGEVLVDRVTQWRQRRTPIKAHTRVVAENQLRHIPRERHDHVSAFADGAFDVVVATMSYGPERDLKLLEEQKAFYSELGFKSWRKTRDEQAPQSFQRGIESGEWDVLLKQAHSAGDLVNLMWIGQEGDWWRAERIRADGRTDRVHLFVPEISKKSSKFWISLEAFRNWVKNREAATARELVWINLSCNSGAKAVREIQAVNSGVFVPIASVGRVEPLQRSQKLGLEQVPLIMGLLDGKSFAEIQESLNLKRAIAGPGTEFAFPNDANLIRNLRLFGQRSIRIDQVVSNPRSNSGHMGY